MTHDSVRDLTTPDEGARRAANLSATTQHCTADTLCGVPSPFIADCQPAVFTDESSGSYPADFSSEEARFAEALRARFTTAQGAIPPLYAQTLLGDDPDGALADPLLAPLTPASEHALIRRVFSVVRRRAAPPQAPVNQKDLCELPAHRSSY